MASVVGKCGLATALMLSVGVTYSAAQDPSAVNERLTGALNWASLGTQEVVSRKITDAYKAARPNVDVEYNPVPGTTNDLRAGLITRQLANNMPDVFQIADRFPRQFGEAGLTGDLSEYLTQSQVTGRDYFAPTFLKQYEVQGGEMKGTIQGLPQSADVVVLYYNTKDFDEAGLAYPNEDWDWNDLVSAAGKLKRVENGQTVRYGFGARYAWHASYVPAIKAYGGEFYTSKNRVDLTSEAAIRGFETYYNHILEGVFAPPAALKSQGGDEATAFGNGYVSMLAFTRSGLPRIRALKSDGFDVTLLPKINGERVTGMGSIGLAASPSGLSNNKDVVYDFLDWYFSAEGGMKVLAANYAVVPASIQLFDSPIWRGLPAPPANTQPFVTAIQYGIQNPANIPTDAQGSIDQNLREAEEAIVIGGTPLKDALAAAEEQINADLAMYDQ